MPHVISTNDKLVSIAAMVEYATPCLEKLSNELSNEFAAGDSDTVRVEVVNYPIVNDGATGADSELKIPGVDVQVFMFNTKLPLSAVEKTLDIESFDRQIAAPTGVSIASFIEKKVIAAAFNAAEHVSVSTGTFAQLDSVHADIRDARMGKEMFGLGSNRLLALIRQNGMTTFGQSVGEKMYSGWVQNYDGVDYFSTADMPVITTGVMPVAGTSTVTEAVNTDGATQIKLGGLSAATGTVKKGTVFTVTDVYAVDLLGNELSTLRTFVVLADATVSGSAATVTVAPIYFKAASGQSDPRQNVSVTSIAATTTIATVPQAANTKYLLGVVIDPKCVVYATKAPLPYKGLANSESKIYGKIALRYGEFPNGTDGSQLCRWDGLFGAKAVLGKGIGLVMAKA